MFFLRTSPLFSLLFFSISAIAQTEETLVNVEDINHRNDQEMAKPVTQKKKDRKTRENNLISKIDKHLVNGLSLPENQIPKKRPLITSADQMRQHLLSCVDSLLSHHQGGYDSPKISRDLLLLAMDHNGWSDDEVRITAAVSQCDLLSENLHSYKKKNVNLVRFSEAIASLSVENAAQKKAKVMIQKLISRSVDRCYATTLELEAGMLVADVSIGPDKMTCIQENGKVYHALGIRAGFGMGLGMGARLISTGFEQSSKIGPITYFIAEDYNPGSIITGIGSIGDEGKSKKGFAAGLLISCIIAKAGISVRVLPGKRRWDLLIDALK